MGEPADSVESEEYHMRSMDKGGALAGAVGILVLAAGCSDSSGGGGSAAPSTLSGTVLGPGLMGLEGAVVEVTPDTTLLLGGTGAKQATTDDQGNFVIVAPPTGNVHVHIDGSNVAGGTFASLELALVVGGGAAILPQPIVLPDLSAGSSLDVAVDAGNMTTVDSTVGDPMVDGYSLSIPTGTTITVDGSAPVGGIVPVNITPVPAINVPMPLPGTLDAGAFVTIQPPGAAFDPPLSITLPNTDDLPLGRKVDIWSFDHDMGKWVNRSAGGNQGEVMDIGGTTFIVANNVITEGGWHAGVIDVDPNCATTIAGQVFIAGSSAVPLANVLISLSTGQFATTGSDGRFSIPSVPAYVASLLPKCVPDGLELRALGPVSHGANLAQIQIEAQIIEIGGTTNLTAFDIPVSLTGTLVGTVTDAQGLPANGTVEISGPEDRSVQTSQGAFFASSLTPGDYTANFVFESSREAAANFPIVQNQVTNILLREPGGPTGSMVVVRTVDLTSEGFTGSVAGACITLVGQSGAQVTGVTNIAGLVQFDNAPAGPYTVTAQIDTPLLPSGTLRSGASLVGVNANGSPPTIVVPFFDTGADLPPVTTDARLEGEILNGPLDMVIQIDIANEAIGFFEGRTLFGEFLDEDIPSGVPLDIGLTAVDPLTFEIHSGIFLSNVQATPGQTLTIDFDFASASAHPFDRQIAITYSNLPAFTDQFLDIEVGDLEYFSAVGLPDTLQMPDLSRSKFASLPVAFDFVVENIGTTFEDSFCDVPLGSTTPTSLQVTFISPPNITSPADNEVFTSYGPGNVAQFSLGAGAGTGAGFNGITFSSFSQTANRSTFWDILVAPGVTSVTLPPVFPGKEMFAEGFAAVNVDTVRFTFPGFSFANFFDSNLPANLGAVESNALCGASQSHFFSVGSGLTVSPPDELARRLRARPSRLR